MQEILGQYSIQDLRGETATVGSSLVSKDVARAMMRAVNIENSGIMDSAALTLMFGDKYQLDDDWVRVNNSDGFAWTEIGAEAITSGYGIQLSGSKQLEMSEMNYRKMVASAQYLLQSPQIQGQVEVLRQLAEKSGYRNVDSIIFGGQDLGPAGQNPSATSLIPQPSTAGGPAGSNVQNDMASQMGAQTVEANSGAMNQGSGILV